MSVGGGACLSTAPGALDGARSGMFIGTAGTGWAWAGRVSRGVALCGFRVILVFYYFFYYYYLDIPGQTRVHCMTILHCRRFPLLC
jgi:hypothetical protein